MSLMRRWSVWRRWVILLVYPLGVLFYVVTNIKYFLPSRAVSTVASKPSTTADGGDGGTRFIQDVAEGESA